MAFQNRIALVFLILNYIAIWFFLGSCKVVIKKFENCDQNESYKVKIHATFKTVDNKQYANATIFTTALVDNNLKVNVSVETLVGNQYVYLFAITEKRGCDALNKYFGEFWYDLERHAGIIPGLCPIARGRYHLYNYYPDWSKMATLQSFPFGQQKFVFMVYESNNSVFTCFVLEGTYQF